MVLATWGADPGKSLKPYLKNKLKGLRACLKWYSKCEALSSIPSTTKKKKKEKRNLS
jgi:hypothetical protein